MHGIVHKTLKTYVIERADEASWDAVLERSELEPKLYLPVSYYDDEEVEVILETLAAMSGHDAAVIERDFGSTLAAELLTTFRAHFGPNWALFDLLENLEGIVAELNAKTDEMALPAVGCTRESDRVAIVSYRSERGHEAMAHGVLEGIVDEFDADATVTRLEGDGGGCSFRVERAA